MKSGTSDSIPDRVPMIHQFPDPLEFAVGPPGPPRREKVETKREHHRRERLGVRSNGLI
jgi:hypothetical protein